MFLDEVGRRLGREGGDDEGRAFEGFGDVRRRVQALGKLGEVAAPAVPQLIEFLKDEDWGVCSRVSRCS